MCGPHFYSMKMTEDVRKFAAEQKISEKQTLQVGLEQKAKSFRKKPPKFTRKRKGRGIV
jgi:phosphomethylpyrimidine synthase